MFLSWFVLQDCLGLCFVEYKSVVIHTHVCVYLVLHTRLPLLAGNMH